VLISGWLETAADNLGNSSEAKAKKLILSRIMAKLNAKKK
jgi:hypothetical protein